MKLTYITDPGHGWLLVTIDQVEQVGLSACDFSGFSYRQGNTLALEEDLDMGVFLEAYQAKHKETPLIQAEHLGYDAPIRSWHDI